MKTGMVLDVDFPPDDRPEKEALSLIDAGFKVYLLCIPISNWFDKIMCRPDRSGSQYEMNTRQFISPKYRDLQLFEYTTSKQTSLKANHKGIYITRFYLNNKIRKKLSAAYLALPFYRWIREKQIEDFVKNNKLER